jgi:hypothetical protein
MGMMLGMKCGCGYAVDIVIGSGMCGGYCELPHFCVNCGVVNVDVLVDDPQCPKCASTNVLRYGETEKANEFAIMGMRVPKFDTVSWVHDPRVSRPKDDHYESWDNWRISTGDHLCPKCSQITLHVSRDSIGFFD